MNKVVIVMPTYMEAENIGPMIDELVGKEFPKIDGVDMQLLIVNDLPLNKSTDDGTGAIVKEKMKKYKNIHIIEDTKKGLGWAYIRGMKYAMKELKADAVMEMDADFQHPPKYVKDMVAAYMDGADYVIGSRYVTGGSVPKEWDFQRKAISFLGNLFIRVVLIKPKLHDLTTGFRLTKVKNVLDKIDLNNLMEPTRFAYKVDLLYQSIKNAKKVVEVPFNFAPRTKEKSKYNSNEIFSTLKVAVILGIKDKQRFLKFATVGFIGYIINALGLQVFHNLGLIPAIASALGAEFSIVSNFTLNNIWTFSESKVSDIKTLFFKFFQFNLSSVGAVIIQAIVVQVLSMLFGDKYLQIYLIIAIGFFVVPYNYTMYNLFIWKTWKLPWAKKTAKVRTT
jgi:dolichol-phosphate mannosyltransferase